MLVNSHKFNFESGASQSNAVKVGDCTLLNAMFSTVPTGTHIAVLGSPDGKNYRYMTDGSDEYAVEIVNSSVDFDVSYTKGPQYVKLESRSSATAAVVQAAAREGVLEAGQL